MKKVKGRPEVGTLQEIETSCIGELHPKAVRGIELFNLHRYWHAHEVLEIAWLAEPGPVRHLYRGILQAGVVYLHVQRGNYRGATKVYQRCRRWLDPFPELCRGVDVGQLRQDLEGVFSLILQLGPDRLDEIDDSMLRPIRMRT